MMSKKALVLCNGEPPSKTLLKYFWERSDFRICADGGANTALQYGFIPDAIIGDLDSLDPSFKDHNLNIIPISIVDTNDADKAICYCLENGITHVDMLGATGLRSSQFLANIEVLYKYSKQLQIVIWNEIERIEVIHGRWQIPAKVNDIISLFPLFCPLQNLKSGGLKFPLQDIENFQFGVMPSGLSNRIISLPAWIECNIMLTILERKSMISVLGQVDHTLGETQERIKKEF